MKNLISKILLLSFLLPTPQAFPALQPSDKQFSPGMSAGIMANPGFEFGIANWTASGGTFTTIKTPASAANIFTGNAAGSWDSNGASQTLLSSITYTNGGGPTLTNQVAGCMVKCATGNCTHTFTVDDGTNPLATAVTIKSSTTGFTPVIVNYIAGTGGTVRPNFTSVASNEPILYIDGCWSGAANVPGPNISQVSQATFYGSITYAAAANCEWTTGNTGAAFTAFGADTDCATPTVAGNASAPATKIPGITFATLPPGEYLVIANALQFSETLSVTANLLFQLYDGATGGTARSWVDVIANAQGNPANELSSRFSYSTAQGSTTFQLRALSSSDSNDPYIFNSASPGGLNFSIHVYRFPTSAQTALSNNQQLLPTVQIFPSGSGTYATPPGVSSIVVTAVGGGAGGSGSSTVAGNNGGTGGTGGTTTFGTSLITAAGAVGGAFASNGFVGGAPTINSPAIDLGSVTGGGGGGGGNSVAAGIPGSIGGVNPRGGSCAGAATAGTAGAGVAKTGAGGCGGPASATAEPGVGGGAGAFAKARINNPSSSYSYAVGAAGTAGSAGTGGGAGGAGGSGVIIVEEFYGAIPYPLLIQSVTNPSSSGNTAIVAGLMTHTADATCTVSTGTGWTPSCSSTGVVTVTFTTAFAGTPTCVLALAANVNDISCRASSVATTGFTSTCANAAGTGSNQPSQFVCFGPR